jgi:para-aminobenzoate synthetase component 1
MNLFSAFLGGWVQPADVFVQFYSGEQNAFWLDGEFAKEARFSVLGAGPALEPNTEVSGWLKDFEVERDLNLPINWRPGLVGCVTYEGATKFIAADRAIVFDHDRQGLYFLGRFESQSDFDFWHHAALLRLGISGGQVANFLHQHSANWDEQASRLRHSAEDYLSMITAAQEHIEAGDVYQICLTNEISVETREEPLSVFLRLRESNPAPYSAFIRIGETSLVSSSPEQFLRVDASGLVSTKPIKGTRPRGDSLELDREIAEDLRSDSKERAENLMIVDLMRNDIGRVSKVGSVAVPKLFDIESYATVHQLVSTVTGELADDQTAWSAVISAFPGGSMTGAPKIRAMEIIDQLERGKRGLYSGCVGYLGGDGSAEFAMVIRSIVFEGERATIGVGGGITIDSNAFAELEETKLKARALLAALNAADPWA